MNFFIVEFQAKDPQYKQYNGRVAITLGWSLNTSDPHEERYVIITPWEAKDYPEWIRESYPYTGEAVGNNIIFQYPRPVRFETSDMPKFTERLDIPMPKRSWKYNRYSGRRERKKYEWSFGKWICAGYEEEKEEEE